jgi:hypothetical protein
MIATRHRNIGSSPRSESAAMHKSYDERIGFMFCLLPVIAVAAVAYRPLYDQRWSHFKYEMTRS